MLAYSYVSEYVKASLTLTRPFALVSGLCARLAPYAVAPLTASNQVWAHWSKC
jgi:hypothetical protein